MIGFSDENEMKKEKNNKKSSKNYFKKIVEFIIKR